MLDQEVARKQLKLFDFPSMSRNCPPTTRPVLYLFELPVTKQPAKENHRSSNCQTVRQGSDHKPVYATLLLKSS